MVENSNTDATTHNGALDQVRTSNGANTAEVAETLRQANGRTAFGDRPASGGIDGTLDPSTGSGGLDKMRIPFESDKTPIKELFDKMTATNRLDAMISPFATQQHAENMENLHRSVIYGNPEQMRDILDREKGPEQRRQMVEELNRHLEKAGSDVSVKMDKSGNVVISGSGDRGVQIGVNGDIKPVVILHLSNGQRAVGGEIIDGNANKIMGNLGRQAVDSILGRTMTIQIPHIWQQGPPGIRQYSDTYPQPNGR